MTMTIVDFINEFERLYNNITKYKMELPTAVLAYRLLKSADMTKDKQQLAMTMISFSYDCMKKQLRVTYDSISQESIATPVKADPTYELKGYSGYGKDGYYNRRQRSSNFAVGRGRNRFNRGGKQNTNWRNPSNDPRKPNPLNSHGNVS